MLGWRREGWLKKMKTPNITRGTRRERFSILARAALAMHRAGMRLAEMQVVFGVRKSRCSQLLARGMRLDRSEWRAFKMKHSDKS